MNKTLNSVLVLAIVAVLSIAFVSVSDSSDAVTTYEVNDSQSLNQAIESVSSGDVLLFSEEFELTEGNFVKLPYGVKVVAGTIDGNQSLIVATTIIDGREMIVGCYDEMKDFNHYSNNNLSKVIEGLDNIILAMAADSYVVNGAAHVIIPYDLTIIGNGATLVQTLNNKTGEADVGIAYVTNSNRVVEETDVTYNISNLSNVKVWNGRYSDHTWTVNLINCDSSSEDGVGNNGFVMIRGGEGKGLVELNIRDCNITSNQTGDGNTAVHTDRYVVATIENCTFQDIPVAVNIKSDLGASSVTVDECSFTDCGYADGELGTYSAPIRIAAGESSESMNVMISGCSFFYNDGESKNGDVLIGDGRSGKVSGDVTVRISNTSAEVQYQSPGYYGDKDDNYAIADESMMAFRTVAEDEILTSVGNDVTIEAVEPERPFIPPIDDEDDYIPPAFVVTEEPEDDTTAIVACAAAAAVAAIMAVFLIIDRKR